MRAIHPDLKARLNSGATTLCRCWKLTRTDGVELGFTDHDGAIVFDGVEFQADSGMDASALLTATGLAVDNGQAAGALNSAAIGEDDIRAGLYDGAEIWHWLVDWRRPDLRILLFRGELGEIRRTDGAFEVELRGLTEKLNVSVGRSVLRTCDRALGDHKCRVDVTQPEWSAEGAVAPGSEGTRLIFADLVGYAKGWFAHGTLTWLDGANAGRRHSIKSDTGDGDSRIIALWQQPSYPVSVGDRATLVAGCDKRAGTCREKFSNFINFRGFPHIPGEDWVTAYPKEGFVHDGSSRQR